MLRKSMMTLFGIVTVCTIISAAHAGTAVADWRSVKPTSIVDLRTVAGAQLVQAAWRVRDAAIIDVDHHAPGSDLKPTGPANRTHDLTPHAGAADFDDAAWEKVDPIGLEQRRGDGRLSFAWYRVNITIPEKLGEFATVG